MSQHPPDSLSLKSTILTIRSYLFYLLGKWWVYFLVIAIALAISFFYLSVRPHKYIAKTTFMTSSGGDSGLSSMLQLAAGQFGIVPPSSGGNTLSADKLIELMGTKTIIIGSLLKEGEVDGQSDMLINHYLKMRNDYSDDHKFTSTQIAEFSIDENDMAEDILTNVQERVLEANSSENGIIRASVKMANEQLAKQFLDKLVAEVSHYHTATATEKEERELEMIQDRADSIKQALDVAEYNLSSWYDRQSRSLKAAAVSAQSYVQQVKLDREAEILGQSYIEIVKGLELTKLSLLRQTPVIQIIDPPSYPLDSDEPNKLMIFGLSIAGLLGLTTLILILRKMIKDALNS